MVPQHSNPKTLTAQPSSLKILMAEDMEDEGCHSCLLEEDETEPVGGLVTATFPINEVRRNCNTLVMGHGAPMDRLSWQNP